MKRVFIGALVLWCLAGVATAGAQEKTVMTRPQDYVPYDKAPDAIKKVQPKYPAAASKDSIEGTVWLKVWIDETGTVAQVNVVKSNAERFDEPAITAAKQWTFKPAMKDGKPVALWVTIPFRFKLQERENDKLVPLPGTIEVKQKPPAEDLKVDKDPEAIKQVNPKYPEQAFQDGIEGTVWMKMWIDATGNVVEAKVSKTDNDVLNEAAIVAGKQWKFRPALLNGNPVAVWITVPFRFAISVK
jgi:TonB family protein